MNVKKRLQDLFQRLFKPSSKRLQMTDENVKCLMRKIDEIIRLLHDGKHELQAAQMNDLRDIVFNKNEEEFRKYVLSDVILPPGAIWDTYFEHQFELIKFQILYSQMFGIIQHIGIDNRMIQQVKHKLANGFLTDFADQADNALKRANAKAPGDMEETQEKWRLY